MIKAVIFDCFGVLISDPLKALIDTHSQQHPTESQNLDAIIQATNKGIFDVEYCHTAVMEALGLDIATFNKIVSKGEVKNKELLNYAKRLRSTYKVGVLSNINFQGLNARFTEQEQSKFFDTVVASGDIGYAKPHIEAYTTVCNALGVLPHESIMVDDRPDFCEGAKGAGMQAVQYLNFAQLKNDLATEHAITTE